MVHIKRGDIFKLQGNKETIGSEQKGDRFCVIIQNDVGNTYSPTVIVALATTQCKTQIPTHTTLTDKCNGLPKTDSLILCEQIMTVDKKRLMYKTGFVSEKDMDKVDKSLRISLGLK